jgi:hypothetical protein
MTMHALVFISIAAGSYYFLSIVQTVLHRYYGHKRRIQAVFEAHAIGHHGQYPANRLQSKTFLNTASNGAKYYGIPIVFIMVIVYGTFGAQVAFAHLLGVIATFGWHLYLHRQYHLIDSPLQGFAWFREKRHLHFVHHRNARANFAVVEFWVDTLMGTRREF